MSKIPAINQSWPEQGGIYIGARLVDGEVRHIVIPGGVEHNIERVAFKDVDGCIPKEINGHSDWRAPDQEDMMLAYINAREHFVCKGNGSIYWTRTQKDGWPWAVVFEYGYARISNRSTEFRVCPVRSIADSAL